MKRLDDGRTFRTLYADEVRQTTDLGKSQIESEEERAVADGNEDIVRHRVAQLVIDLLRHALDPIGEKRVVDMGGIVVAAEFCLKRTARIHAPVRHTHDIRAVRRDLLGALGRNIIRHIDPARHARRCSVCRNRSARVARGVDRYAVDADVCEFADESLCPAILEGSRRLAILHLEKEAGAVDDERQERCLRLAERHRLVTIRRIHRRLIQAKKSAALTHVCVCCDGVFLFTALTVEVHDRSSS